MARLGTVDLQTLRSDLRSRLGEMDPDDLNDQELDRWLNVGQQDLAIKLNGISDIWYGTRQADITATDCGAGAGVGRFDISSLNVQNVVAITNNAGDTDYPLKDIKKLRGYFKNINWKSQQPVFALFGRELHCSDTTAPDSITLFYYRMPDDMTSDDTPMDVKDAFQEPLIQFAQAKALARLNRMAEKKEVEQDINRRLDDISKSFQMGMAVDKVREAK